MSVAICNMQVNKVALNTEQANTVKDSDSKNTGFQTKKKTKQTSPSIVTTGCSNSICQHRGKEHIPCTE